MSQSKLPQRQPLYSDPHASIGARLNLTSERGDEHAKLVWIVILSHTPWPGRRPGPTWASNVTLAHETGLYFRRVQQAFTVLREAGMLETPLGHRPGARRPYGRLLVPRLGAPVKLLIPDRGDMANLWELCRERRKRPAPMVTMMVGAYALASDHAGHRPREWTPLGCSQTQWRRFVGARKNAAWTARVSECESLDLVRRNGRVIEIAPARSWLRSWRAMESLAEQDDRGLPSDCGRPHVVAHVEPRIATHCTAWRDCDGPPVLIPEAPDVALLIDHDADVYVDGWSAPPRMWDRHRAVHLGSVGD